MDAPQAMTLIDRIRQLPADFHGSGLGSIPVLKGIVRRCGTTIESSMETGSGLTTLLFSNISRCHTVFAVDDGKSISAVKSSELFRAEQVEYIIAPTQQSLPKYQFLRQYDVALLDGPHGYPFPDLEYYYVYPHIKQGGYLLVDDIHIPTIANLYRFLREDEMFQLVEVVGTTAFFRRTDATLFDAYADGWWLQRYNARRYPVGLRLKLREWYHRHVKR